MGIRLGFVVHGIAFGMVIGRAVLWSFLAWRDRANRALATRLTGDWRTAGYDRAAASQGRARAACLPIFRLPEAQWTHLRTSNALESIFPGVRPSEAARGHTGPPTSSAAGSAAGA